MKAAFDDGGGNIAALRALGMDAYRIVGQWHWVAGGEPLYGATGKLTLDTATGRSAAGSPGQASAASRSGRCHRARPRNSRVPNEPPQATAPVRNLP